MNLNKSTLRSTFRSPNNNNSQGMSLLEIENEIIDNNLMKSYMFQAATKSKAKGSNYKEQSAIQPIKQFHTRSQILRSTSQQKRYKIFKSVLKQEKNYKVFKVLMSNVAANSKQTFSCCSASGVKEPVTVYAGEYRDITIKNRKQTEILYQFNFNTIYAKLEETQIDPTTFMLDIDKAILIKFEIEETDTNIQIQTLKQIIKRMLNDSLGQQFSMDDLKSIPNFQKTRYTSVAEFAENCQTGDLLLFRGNMFWAKIQRFFTNSQYDHVGMLYKDPIHGILIFESTSQNGICLSPWEYVVKYKWYQYIDRIVWRKLVDIQRSDDFIEKMQQLIMDKIGKAYHISFQKLMTNQSYVYSKKKPTQQKSFKMTSSQEYLSPQQQKQDSELLKQPTLTKNISKQNQPQQGYFCSQLVAKMYKGLGLLPQDKKDPYYKASNNTYPYHFTQKYDLHMKKGHLGDQAIIHFHNEAIKEYYGFQE